MENLVKLRRKKEKEDEIPDEWKETKGKKGTPVFTEPKTKTRRTWRFPRLLLFKRVIACILFLVNGTIGVTTLFSLGAEPLSIVFLPTTFILLDYVWKTRRTQIEWNREQ